MDPRPWQHAIRRASMLLSFVSFLPLISNLRFGGRLRQHAGEDAQKEKKPAEPAMALPSALLLLASELLGCFDLFKAAPKGKGRMSAFVTVVQQAVRDQPKGRKGAPSGGVGSIVLDFVAKGVVSVLGTDDMYDVVHSLFMLIALSSTLGLIVFGMLSQSGALRKGRGYALLIAPLFLFLGASHGDALGKAWKAFALEKVTSAIRTPLRISALVLTTPPKDEARGGTPALFAAFQVASLAAAFSSEIASGRLHEAFVPFKNKPFPDAIFDSNMLAVMLPLVLGILWLSWVHLRDNTGGLFAGAMLAVATSPVALMMWWPKASGMLGLSPGPDALVSAISCAYALATLALFLSGGTVSLISVMGLLHVLSGVHGIEALGLSEAMGMSG